MDCRRSDEPAPLPQQAAGTPALEFRGVGPDLEGALAAFFESLRSNGDEKTFHPHPLTWDEALRLCCYRGKDLYYVAIDGASVLGYGMLRGWDEGYAVPSLGIAVAPGCRGLGLARSFMVFLHAAARLRGARAVRLKVYEDNIPARNLYESLGYRYVQLPEGELLGVLDLGR